MEYLQGILLGIAWIGGIILMRSITTLFHELGHAIPALIFTKKEKVNVFVGTYGDLSNSLQLHLGRLALYLKLNVFNWRIGLCTHGGVKGLFPQIMVILGGPFASLLIAAFALYIITTKNYPQFWTVFVVLFLISAIIDFLVNIDPSHTPIKLYNNSVTYSDGYQLINVFKRRGLPEPFFKAEKLYHEKKYAECLAIVENLINTPPQKKQVYDLKINCHIAKKDYVEALNVYDSFKAIHPYAYTDFYQLGWLNYKVNRWDEALSYFDHCNYEHHMDGLVLAHRGYIHLQRGNIERAEQDLVAAISYSPDNPMAWNNNALLKIKKGDLEGANLALKQALHLAPKSPDVYYHIGIFHEEKRAFKEALANYQLARDLGLDYHGIELKIADIEAIVDSFL